MSLPASDLDRSPQRWPGGGIACKDTEGNLQEGSTKEKAGEGTPAFCD